MPGWEYLYLIHTLHCELSLHRDPQCEKFPVEAVVLTNDHHYREQLFDGIPRGHFIYLVKSNLDEALLNDSPGC